MEGVSSAMNVFSKLFLFILFKNQHIVWRGVWRLMAKVMKNDHFFYPSLTNFMQMQRAAPKDKWLSNTLKCSISYDLHHCQPIWVTYGLTSRLLRSLSCLLVRPSSNQRLVWIDFCTGRMHVALLLIFMHHLFVKWVQAVKLLWLWSTNFLPCDTHG